MNLAPGAWRYALPPFVAAPFAFVISPLAAVALAALGAGVLAFFRDPERTPPPSGTVAPADGTVSVLRSEDGRTRLGIFMNVWHVHVARSPFDATVVDVEHVPGAYKPAFSKDSDRNERVHVALELEEPARLGREDDAIVETDDAATRGDDAAVETDDDAVVQGDDVAVRGDDDAASETPDEAVVTFVAGAFARRIHPYVEPGDRLERGERIGHIAFGSRVDVLFPEGVDLADVAVEPGDSTRAGETVILPAGVAVEGADSPLEP